VSNLGVNQGGTMFSPTSTNAQRFGVGLNLAVGTASVLSSGDRSLQQSLRALSIAGGVWNTGGSLITAKQSFSATVRAMNAARQPRQMATRGTDSGGDDHAGTSAQGKAKDGRIQLVSGQETDQNTSSERNWIHLNPAWERIEAEAEAAEQAGDLETAKRLRSKIVNEWYDPEPDRSALAIFRDDEPIGRRAPMIDEMPANPAPSNFWDFSESIGMDFTGFGEGYSRSLNPWSENAQAPVDNLDRLLQFGQKTSITVGAGALTALGAIYAAPYAIAGASSAASSFGSMSVYVQTQVAAGVTGASTFVATNGPRIAAFASDKISRLNMVAQSTANWFNSRPFVRERILEAVEGYAESGSTEGALGNAIVGSTIDVGPGMMSAVWTRMKQGATDYIGNFTGNGRSFHTLSIFGGIPFFVPSSNAPKGVLPRNAPEFGGFAQGITPEEISAINRVLGGMTTITGDVSTTLANAARREGFWNKAATIVRDIAGGHMFNDANKRTTQAVVEELMQRNDISTGVTADQMKQIIQQVATGALRQIEDIASALRGF
jgi:hypothetical protein